MATCHLIGTRSCHRRRRRAFHASLALLLVGPGFLRAQVVTADLAIYPAPAGAAASTQYSVQVWTGNAWAESFVNFDPARTSGSGAGDEPGKSFSWTTFETTTPVKVRVRRLEGGFQFGWFPKSNLHKVTVSNIDIIHFENWYGVGQSNRAVFNYANAGGPGTIEDITFSNVNVEGPILRLFGFNTVGRPQVIRDFTFNNLGVPEGMGVGNLGAPRRDYFLGNITDFEFNNFVFDGAVVGSAEQALFDYGNGAGSGFTFNPPGPPIVEAGPDQTITLPVDSVTLNGTATDYGGTVTGYGWTKESGPSTYSLSAENTPDLTASGQVVGTYIFRLTVTDDNGMTGHDEAAVTVYPALVWLAIVLGMTGHSAMYAPQAAFFSELFETRVRYSDASIGYQLASPFAGGLAPLIATALLGFSGQASWPVSTYLIVVAGITLTSIFLATETFQSDLAAEPGDHTTMKEPS